MVSPRDYGKAVPSTEELCGSVGAVYQVLEEVESSNCALADELSSVTDKYMDVRHMVQDLRMSFVCDRYLSLFLLHSHTNAQLQRPQSKTHLSSNFVFLLPHSPWIVTLSSPNWRP